MVGVEFMRALALRSEIRRAGWFSSRRRRSLLQVNQESLDAIASTRESCRHRDAGVLKLLASTVHEVPGCAVQEHDIAVRRRDRAWTRGTR